MPLILHCGRGCKAFPRSSSRCLDVCHGPWRVFAHHYYYSAYDLYLCVCRMSACSLES